MSGGPARTRKPRGQGHERRPEILAAAKDLFVAEGYEGFTTRKLAARVGLSQTGLYVYFGSKEEIYDALCRQSFARLAEAFREVLATTDEGFGRLRALGHAYADFGHGHPDEYRLTFMDGPGLIKSPEHASMPMDRQGLVNQVFLMIWDTLRGLRDAGALRPVDLAHATHPVWFALHGLGSLFLARPRFPPARREDLVEALLDDLIEGLRTRSP